MSPSTAAWEPPYVDVSTTVGIVDTPPAGGVDVDPHPGGEEGLGPDAIEVGEQLGEEIDLDDDLDNGGVPLVEPEPGQSVLPPLEEPEPTGEPPVQGGQS